jgi:uncharacterized membrane protein (DUF2068 family)
MYPDIVCVFQSILVLSLMAYLQYLALPSYHLYISPPRPSQTQLKINMVLVEYLLVLLRAFK